jgi:heme A synthase
MRGPVWPTVVLMASITVTLAADIGVWLQYHAGYPHPYEYWPEGTLGPIAFGVVGWFIWTRVPGNRLGPLMVTALTVGTAQAVMGVATVYGTKQDWPVTVLAWTGGFFAAMQLLVVGLTLVIFQLAPTGNPISRQFSNLTILTALSAGVAILTQLLLGPDLSQLKGGPGDASIASIGWRSGISASSVAAGTVLVVCSILTIVELVVRWRRTAVTRGGK